MKVEKLVTRSLRLLQVIDPLQAVKPAYMESGIDALNGLMRRWEANGLTLGWTSVVNPSDDLPLPEEAEQAVAYNLAMILAPEWGVTPLPAVVAYALDGLSDLLRDQAVATPIQPILDIPWPQGWNCVDFQATSWYVS